MKKLFLCICFLFISSEVWAQNQATYFDSPRRMTRTFLDASRVTVDYYINMGNKNTQTFYNDGTLDLHIQQIMIGQSTATLTIEAYGILRRNYATAAVPAGNDSTVTAYVDSTRVASFSIDNVVKIYAVDGLFTTFKMYDGIRLALKLTVQDSAYVFSGLRNRYYRK